MKHSIVCYNHSFLSKISNSLFYDYNPLIILLLINISIKTEAGRKGKLAASPESLDEEMAEVGANKACTCSEV
jgi:hypothetical protein